MIDKQEVKAPDIITAYSSTIEALMDLGQLAGSGGKKERLNDLSRAFISVLEAKESSGQERAFGAAELAQGALDLKGAIRIVDLVAQQRLGLRTADRLADPDKREMLVALGSSPEGKLVEQLRAEMLASLASGDLGKLTPERWFAATTARINKLKSIEDGISLSLDRNRFN